MNSTEKALNSAVADQTGSLPVESYADRLMDELFEDVEQMLGGNQAAQEPESFSEPVPAETPPSPVPPVILSMVAPTPPAPVEPTNEVPAIPSLAPAETPTLSRVQPSQSYDRLLLAIGCVSLLVTLGVWLLYQEANHPTISTVASAPQVADGAGDQQFAEYAQRSLQIIDQRSQPPASALTINLPPSAGMPTVPVPPTLTPPTSTATNPAGTGTPANPSIGLSRLYAPFYQPPQQPTALPTGKSPFGVAPSVAPLPTSPGASSSGAVKAPIPLSVPGVARTLVGVIEMGDQSAILVEINGVAQRFKLGESIGSSGWTLVEVSKNQAIVRRNGEVRSVFTGQSF